MPTYDHGDYVKVEFEGEQGMPGEWMWVRVIRSDANQQLVFGILDNEPLLSENLGVGQQLAISYDKIRDHRKPWEFKKQ